MRGIRSWMSVLLACVGLATVSEPARAQAVDVEITYTLDCGAVAVDERYLNWGVQAVSSRSISFQEFSSSNAYVFDRSFFNGRYSMRTWHRGYFGPVTLTVTYLYDDDPGTLQTTSRTVNLTREQCTSVPSVRFESRCDGSMTAYVSNAASAGLAAQFSITDSNGRPVDSTSVSPGMTATLGVPAGRATHVEVGSYPDYKWAASWQQAGCVGPPAAGNPGPPAGLGPAPDGNPGTGSGGQGGGDTGQPGTAGSTTSAEPSPSVAAAAGTASPSPSGSAAGVTAGATENTAAGRASGGLAVPVIVGLSAALGALLLAGVVFWRRRSLAPVGPEMTPDEGPAAGGRPDSSDAHAG